MAAIIIPDGPLQDAAAAVGEALQNVLTRGGSERTAELLRGALQSLFAAAKDAGTVARDLDRARRQNDRVLAANLALSKRLMQAQGTSEDLVRDLAPALEEITVVFQRAIQRQLAFASIRDAHVPVSVSESPTADTVDAIRHAPIEAHGAFT